MKASLARAELVTALSVVNKGLSSRTTLPILSGILMKGNDGRLTLSSTDLDVSVQTSVEARIEREGTAVVPGRLFADIVRSFPEGAVTISVDGGTASVACGTSTFTLKTLSADEFPRFPEMDPQNEVTIDAATFTSMVQKVTRAVSRDETRPVLTGALVEVKNGTLTMVATDSYRLCLVETETGGSQEFEAVIPGRALDDVSRLLTDGQDVVVSAAQNQISFRFGDSVFVTRRIEGVFPNFRQLLPTDRETQVTIDRDEMLAAVKRVSLMAQHSAPLRITVVPEERTVTLSAQTHDVGEATEVLEADAEGQAVEMAFNHAYLADGIAGAESEKITLDIISPMKPGVIRSTDGIRYTYLLMPVRLG